MHLGGLTRKAKKTSPICVCTVCAIEEDQQNYKNYPICRAREFNIANEEWEAEDDTKDRLPAPSRAQLFAIGGELYVLDEQDKTYRYKEGGVPAWELVPSTEVQYGLGQNFVYEMTYHEFV